MISRLDEYKKDGVAIRDVSSNGVEQRRNVTLINEAGMYASFFV